MKYSTFALVFICVFSSGLLKELPSYIQVCQRDPATINDCVLKSIESLKPQLISGIPEIDVPPIDPFFIPEIKSLTGDNANVRASGHNVKVTGASDFKIKSLSVDLDTWTIKTRIRFPKLHLEGEYKVDGQVLIVPLKGAGKFTADAVKCDAELEINPKIFKQDGVSYIKFNKMDIDIKVKDYHIQLEGLFNGDKTLGDATNAAINQNRGDFLRATKPYLERAVSNIILDVANKVVEGLSEDQLLPKP